MGLSRQEYWSELPVPSPGDLPNPGIEPKSPRSPTVASGFLTPAPPRHLPGLPGAAAFKLVFASSHRLMWLFSMASS